MCMCIECVGDLPEPDIVYRLGSYAVFFEGERLTEWLETETRAWDQFKERQSA